jgi:hypothetical protein
MMAPSFPQSGDPDLLCDVSAPCGFLNNGVRRELVVDWVVSVKEKLKVAYEVIEVEDTGRDEGVVSRSRVRDVEVE